MPNSPIIQEFFKKKSESGLNFLDLDSFGAVTPLKVYIVPLSLQGGKSLCQIYLKVVSISRI